MGLTLKVGLHMVEFLEKQLDPSPQKPQVITKGHWQGLVLRAGTHNLPLQSGPWRTIKEPCSLGPRLAAGSPCSLHGVCKSLPASPKGSGPSISTSALHGFSIINL